MCLLLLFALCNPQDLMALTSLNVASNALEAEGANYIMEAVKVH
jgi:hypothetical protein